MNIKGYDGTSLIKAVAEEIKQIEGLETPEWALYVKTGVHKVAPPMEDDWWQMRLASILRKIGILGPIGVSKLRRKYGGKQRKGYKPAKFAKGSGKIIRVCLQQLEKAGFIKQAVVAGNKGRILTNEGIKLLSKAAKNLKIIDSSEENKNSSKDDKKIEGKGEVSEKKENTPMKEKSVKDKKDDSETKPLKEVVEEKKDGN